MTQWVLLALRLALFTLAALILAQLARQGQADRTGDVAYVSRGWALTAGPEALAPLREAHPGGIFLLTPEFPPLTDMANPLTPLPVSRLDTIWPLLAERLSTVRHTGAVTVYATGLSAEMGSHLPELPTEVTWQLLDEVAAIAPPPLLHVLVLHDVQRQADADVVGLALDGIARHRLPGLTWERRPLDAGEMTLDGADRVVVLADEAGTTPQFTPPPAIVLDSVPRTADFPEALLRKLLGGSFRDFAWPDARITADRLAQAATAPPAGQLPHRPLLGWLAGLMLLLWAAERWLSERPGQRHG